MPPVHAQGEGAFLRAALSTRGAGIHCPTDPALQISPASQEARPLLLIDPDKPTPSGQAPPYVASVSDKPVEVPPTSSDPLLTCLCRSPALS